MDDIDDSEVVNNEVVYSEEGEADGTEDNEEVGNQKLI